MDSATLWRLFIETGLPEAYSLYRFLKEAEEAAARGEQSA